MQRLLQTLFPTLVLLSLALPAVANDCPGAIAVATNATSAMQNFDGTCDLQANTGNQRNPVPANCAGEVWFSWVPGMTNANVLDMNFRVTTNGNCNINIFLLYSESKDAGVDPCRWATGGLFTPDTWGYTQYQYVNGQAMTNGVPYNLYVDGLDASGHYFIVVERVSGTGQVSLSPQLQATLPAAANDRCANATILNLGNGIDPNVTAGINGGNWANGASLSTANATKIRLQNYCSGANKGPATEDHYSRYFITSCVPTGNLGDLSAVPLGVQCITTLQNTTYYKFVAPASGTDYYFHFSSSSQCSQEPNQVFAMLYNGGYSCNADNAWTSLINCQPVTVFGSLPGSDFIFSNVSLTAGQTYWIVLDGTRGSQCDLKFLLTKGNVNPVLPVTLNYFRGEQRAGLNYLSWESGSEDQHDRYVVERSADGQSFQSLGEIRSRGEVNQATSYQFADETTPVGKSYYRLRMVDINGGVVYSDIVELQRSVETFSLIGLVPNPATEMTDLIISSPTEIRAGITVMDIQGKTIRNQLFTAESGEHRVPLNVSDLAPGIYLIQVQSGRRAFTEKLVVQ